MNSRTLLYSLAAALLISTNGLCQGKMSTIDINVTANFEPTKGIGLILSEQGTQQLEVRSIIRVNPESMVISLDYNEKEVPRDAVATALVVASDGQTAYGDLRPLLNADSKESYLKIPQCTPEKVSETRLQGQVGLLESLIEVRSARRGVAQVKVAQLMAGDFLSNLNKLEEGFGLNYPVSLSSDLTPVELIDRLSRLSQVVSSAKAAK